MPPNTDGLFDEKDVARLREFGEYIRETFKHDEARKAASVTASSYEQGYPPVNVIVNDKYVYWKPAGDMASGYVDLLFDEPVSFNVIMMQEFIRHGQKVSHYTISILEGEDWIEVSKGTTIGVKKINVLDSKVSTKGVRLTIVDTWNDYVPEISRIGLFTSEYY